ncbi:MAG: 50S ribosomal protein L17 [Bacteroidetes bacterium]|nr:50S ribosomal protein L17 [Bacteroidota bacterium]
MRNRNKINQLSRTSSHRSAMMANMASSLIQHKRITTTVAKAKALRGYVEPLITKSKDDTTHSRRLAFRKLKDKDAVSELFREVGPKVGDRPGGYTRIIKTGFRQGDSAEMCMMELVDFNEIYTSEKKAATKKTRRSRRGTGGSEPKAENVVETAAEVVEEVVEAVEEVTESAEEVVESATEVVEEVAEATEAVEETAEATEEDVEAAKETSEAATETTEEASPEASEEKSSKEESSEGENKEGSKE